MQLYPDDGGVIDQTKVPVITFVDPDGPSAVQPVVVAEPARVTVTNSAGQSLEVTATVESAPHPKDKSVGTCISVMLEGAFGKFKSKAKNLIVGDHHISLQYARGYGDEELAFQPQVAVPFTLKVLLSDGKYGNERRVVNYGLITPIVERNESIVTFLFAPEKVDEYDDQEKCSF